MRVPSVCCGGNALFIRYNNPALRLTPLWAGLLGSAIVSSMFGTIPVFHIPVGLGLRFAPSAMVKGSLWFGRIVTALTCFGLICAGFEAITGVAILPGIPSCRMLRC